MKYMVMECHLSYAVVLNEEGYFLKVANRNYQVGQKVSEVIEMQIPASDAEKKKSYKWVYSLVAAAACVILAMTPMLRMEYATYASVYMTINPEVRIDVNKSDVVVGLAGMNQDGKELITSYNYKKKNLDVVMDELVDLAIDMGYLHKGGQISIVLDAEDNEWVIGHGDALSVHLNEHLTEKMSVTIEVTDKKVRNNQIIIPIDSDDSDYGESEYGESDYGQEPTETIKPVSSEEVYNNSPYEEVTEDHSSYVVPDDSQSDYEQSVLEEEESPYEEAPSYEEDSSYEEVPSYEEDSSYEEAPSYEEDSPYEEAPPYEEPEEDEDSGYEEQPSQDGGSDYEDSDDGSSEYEEDD